MYQQMIQHSCKLFNSNINLASHMPFNIVLNNLLVYCKNPENINKLICLKQNDA